MSKESADKFLQAATYKSEIRDKFKNVTNPQEFIQVSQELGYSFTTEELKAVAKEKSKGVTMRRNTGVWGWLRTINWI